MPVRFALLLIAALLFLNGCILALLDYANISDAGISSKLFAVSLLLAIFFAARYAGPLHTEAGQILLLRIIVGLIAAAYFAFNTFTVTKVMHGQGHWPGLLGTPTVAAGAILMMWVAKSIPPKLSHLWLNMPSTLSQLTEREVNAVYSASQGNLTEMMAEVGGRQSALMHQLHAEGAARQTRKTEAGFEYWALTRRGQHYFRKLIFS